MLKYKFVNVDDDDEEMKEVKEQIQQLMDKTSEKLENMACLAEVPDHSVSVTVNLKAEIINIGIDDSMLSPDKKDELIDYIIYLSYEAAKRADEVYQKAQNDLMEAVEDITDGRIDVRRVSLTEIKELQETEIEKETEYVELNKKLN